MSCLIVAEREWGIKIKNENSLVLFHTSNMDSNCKNPQTKVSPLGAEEEEEETLAWELT